MRSAAGLHALTRGNPLFVSEVLRHGADGVPHGVQDLVLARFARLGAAAQAVVRLASTVPTRIEGTLVEALLAPSAAVVDECLNPGCSARPRAPSSFATNWCAWPSKPRCRRPPPAPCTPTCCARWPSPARPRSRWRDAHSYVTDDLRKTFCIYDAPTPDAIRDSARNNNLPIDSITSVSVLDPYFYRG
jgi:hypothetical protein